MRPQPLIHVTPKQKGTSVGNICLKLNIPKSKISQVDYGNDLQSSLVALTFDPMGNVCVKCHIPMSYVFRVTELKWIFK